MYFKYFDYFVFRSLLSAFRLLLSVLAFQLQIFQSSKFQIFQFFNFKSFLISNLSSRQFQSLLPLQFMAGEIVFVSSPVSDFVGKISPDDSIFVEWQLDHSQVFIKMLDGLVGDEHTDDEEEDK